MLFRCLLMSFTYSNAFILDLRAILVIKGSSYWGFSGIRCLSSPLNPNLFTIMEWMLFNSFQGFLASCLSLSVGTHFSLVSAWPAWLNLHFDELNQASYCWIVLSLGYHFVNLITLLNLATHPTLPGCPQKKKKVCMHWIINEVLTKKDHSTTKETQVVLEFHPRRL